MKVKADRLLCDVKHAERANKKKKIRTSFWGRHTELCSCVHAIGLKTEPYLSYVTWDRQQFIVVSWLQLSTAIGQAEDYASTCWLRWQSRGVE